MLQNNMPENVKKEIINLLADTKTIFGSVEHKIYNANIKKGPLEGCFMAGVVYGTIVVGAYYYSSEMVEENNAPIIHDDGSVEIQEYDPWWMW